MNQTYKKGKGIKHTQWLVHGECWIILNRTKSYSLAVRNEDKNLANVVWMLRIYQVDYLWVQSQANVCLWGVWKLGTFINFFSILFYRYYLKRSEKMSWKSHGKVIEFYPWISVWTMDWTEGLKCDHLVWYWPWPWPWLFKVKYGICYMSAKNGKIATKQKSNTSIEI